MEAARLPAVSAKAAPAVESPGKEAPTPTRNAKPVQTRIIDSRWNGV